MSSLAASINLHLGLPRFFVSWQFHPQHPSPNIPIIFLPQGPTSPNHLNRNRPTCAVPLIWSILVVPTKIVTSSTMHSQSTPPVFSMVLPSLTRTTLLLPLPPCTPSLSSIWYSPVANGRPYVVYISVGVSVCLSLHWTVGKRHDKLHCKLAHDIMTTKK